MALPGLTPTLPLTTEGPVLVTVEAPNMVKLGRLQANAQRYARQEYSEFFHLHLP
jgi:hypothetical protein